MQAGRDVMDAVPMTVFCLLYSRGALGALPNAKIRSSKRFDRPVFNGPVPVVDGRHFSSAEFKEKYLDRNLPVLIRNGTIDWPVSSNPWTDEYLVQTAGDHVGGVEQSESGKFGHEAKGWKNDRLMLYQSFIKNYMKSSKNVYLATMPPCSLMADLRIPLALECILEENQIRQIYMWHGAGHDNTVRGSAGRAGRAYNSLLHNDHSENMYFVASGTKEVSLFDSRLASGLYEIRKKDKTSPVDIDNPDFERHPLLREALPHRIDVEVKEGDLLYIPLLWFHQVYTNRRAVAMTFWWDAHGLQKRFRRNEDREMGSQQILDELLGGMWKGQASLAKHSAARPNPSTRMEAKQQCPNKLGLLSSMSLASLESCKRGEFCAMPPQLTRQQRNSLEWSAEL